MAARIIDHRNVAGVFLADAVRQRRGGLSRFELFILPDVSVGRLADAEGNFPAVDAA